MTRKSLLVTCSIGVLVWVAIILAIHHHTQSWSETGQWCVLILVGFVLLGGIWIGVERDQLRLDEQEMRMRENEAYGFEEEEQQPQPPRAA